MKCVFLVMIFFTNILMSDELECYVCIPKKCNDEIKNNRMFTCSNMAMKTEPVCTTFYWLNGTEMFYLRGCTWAKEGADMLCELLGKRLGNETELHCSYCKTTGCNKQTVSSIRSKMVAVSAKQRIHPYNKICEKSRTIYKWVTQELCEQILKLIHHNQMSVSI